MDQQSIFSKTGKGMLEASGKTSLLPRATRKILSEIDGKSTVSELLKKFPALGGGKLELALAQMQKEGFLRERISAEPAAVPVRPQATPPRPIKDGDDLDFTASGVFSPSDLARAREDNARDLARKQKEEADRMMREAAEIQARREAQAKATAFAQMQAKARALAEASARAKAEAEAAARAESEALARREAEENARKEAEAREAKEKALREIEELRRQLEEKRKAREEAERNAKQEAERIAREAEEKAQREAEEQARREAEEKARREAEEKARLEAEEKARREAEEKARLEAEEKARLEAEEQAQREAEEKARREAQEQARRDAEQKAQREADEQARREAEEIARRVAAEIARREAEDKARREAEEQAKRETETGKKARREAEEKARREAEEMVRREAEEKARRKVEELRQKLEAAERKAKEEAERRARAAEEKAAAELAAAQSAAVEKVLEKTPAKGASGDAFADSLLADLDAFARREEEEAKQSEAEERERKEAVAREKIEAEERSRREEEERERREGEERRRRQEATARTLEEAERQAKEQEERSAREREPKAAEPMGKAQTVDVMRAGIDSIPTSSEDIHAAQVRSDEIAAAREARRAAREREREAERAKRAAAAAAEAAPVAAPVRRVRWGRAAAIGLFLLVAGGLGLLHVMPISTSDYATALSETIGQPVKIGSVNLSLYNGVELKFDNVQIGDGARIARVRASPEPGSLLSVKKAFTQVHLEGAVLPQAMLGGLVFGGIKTDGARIGELSFSDLRIDGSLGLPKLAGQLSFGEDGKVAEITLKGGGDAGIAGRILRKGDSVEFTINAASAPIPFVPGLNLAGFAMSGTANRQEMTVRAFHGRVYDGVISGNARISWSGGWSVAGDVAAKQVNAAVFAPVLISEGKLDANGRYALQGADPARLGPDGRLEGSFTITKGAIGFVDIVRMIQSPVSKIRVRTAFNELAGRGVYNKGATELRDIHMTAGVLNANAVLDIDAAGGVKGRMNADLKSGATARGALSIGISGTLTDPQIRRQ